jgi:hypothetical protein
MTTTQGTAAAQVIDRMVAEGHDRADVQAAFDSMADAGFELDQPDDGYVLSEDEVEMLYDQVGSTYLTEGEVRVCGSHLGYVDCDGGEWEDVVDALLVAHEFRRTGRWNSLGHAPAVHRDSSPALFEVAAARVAAKEADAALRNSVRGAREAGEQKVDIAAAAGITRPTLDAWLGSTGTGA